MKTRAEPTRNQKSAPCEWHGRKLGRWQIDVELDPSVAAHFIGTKRAGDVSSLSIATADGAQMIAISMVAKDV